MLLDDWEKYDEVMGHVGKDQKFLEFIGWKNEEWDYLDDLGIDERITLKLTLEKEGWMVWTILVLFCVGNFAGILWT
jgi:hypothetical protein